MSAGGEPQQRMGGRSAAARRRTGIVVTVVAACVAVLAGAAAAGSPPAGDGRPRLGLALSGGGARGFAQIGVLRVLRDNGIVPDFVTGTSMGSIVGGLYAIGYTPEELEELVGQVDWQDIFRDGPDRRSLFFEQKRRSSRYIVDFVVRGFSIVLPSSISRGDRITNLFTLATLGAPASFDEFPIPFRAVATDIVTGTEVVLDGTEMTLAEAMRASMAIPGVIQPVEIGDRLLVDGMMVKNLPVDTAINLGADRVIAVDTSYPLRSKDELNSIFAVADQAFSLQIIRGTEEQRALADLVIIPELGDFTQADFTRVEELIAVGEAAARAQIERIREIAGPNGGVPAAASVRTDPDQRVRIDSIQMSGDADTRDLALLHGAGIRRGDRLTARELDERIRNIFGSEFLDTVRVATEPTDSGGYRLRLHIERRQSNSVGLGLHYDELYDVVGLVNWTMHGLTGPRSVLAADLLLGSVFGGEISYLQYAILDSPLFVRPRLFARDQEQPFYEGDRKTGKIVDRFWGAELGAGRSLRNLGQVTAGYRWKRVDFTPDSGAATLSRSDDTVTSLFVRTELDTLDAFPFPTDGTLLQLRAEVADHALGGDASFWRASLRAAHYRRLWERHTLFADFRIESAFGSRLPGYEQFVFGGPISFVGFARQEKRGAESTVLQLGYRYRLFDLPLGLGRGAYGTLAYNTGNIWRDLDAVDADFEIEHGGAVGLGLDTFLLPVEIAVGFGSGGRVEAYFTLGFPLGREID
jgi:NTE family protein